MKTRSIIAACLVAGAVVACSAAVVAQRGGTTAGGTRQGGAAAGSGQRGTPPLGPVNALGQEVRRKAAPTGPVPHLPDGTVDFSGRSEEHTSELQSHVNLVCRLL